jgi:AraC family transcriptional regulator of adaptative response/methylated-DNA-[protein]-cysteine methyltransferase
MNAFIGEYTDLADHYHLIEQAIRYLDEHAKDQPELKDVAASVHLSEYHFQRLFTRWVGVSPKRFLQYLTKEYARSLLEQSQSLLDVSYQAGLSGPGRLHDLFVAWEAVSPGEYKIGGSGLEITYAFLPSPFGECLLAATPRGICSLDFILEGDRGAALSALKRRFSNAEFLQDQQQMTKELQDLFTAPYDGGWRSPALHVSGTPFQIKVWEALLRIPSGAVLTYADIAVQIGMPEAARAVGSAMGRNPVAVLIPCHRVIRQTGDFGNYRWGAARKKALLGWEIVKSRSSIPQPSQLASPSMG